MRQPLSENLFFTYFFFLAGALTLAVFSGFAAAFAGLAATFTAFAAGFVAFSALAGLAFAGAATAFLPAG